MIDEPTLSVPDAATVDRDEPWPGLAAFREVDRAFFHGRERAVEELVRLVLRARVAVLYGLSGLGKTSLLRAGAFPLLRQQYVLPVYVRLSHADESRELRGQVRDALAQAAVLARVDRSQWDDDQTLWEYFHRKDVRFWSERNRIVTPLLVFDQFEEVFTQGRATAARADRTARFLSELADLVEGRPSAEVRARVERMPDEALRYSLADQPCRILLSLREDFLPELSSLRGAMPSIAQESFRLLRMSREEALQVVRVDNGRLVPLDVAQEIVRFVASGKADAVDQGIAPTVEPALLSVFCRELNAKRQAQGQSTITADLLHGTAGKEQIIAEFYERTISEAGLNAGVRTFVEERLLTESGFRDSISEEQALRAPGVTAADLEALIARRLLRRDDTGTPGRARVELTHDVLADAVRISRDRRRLREEEERRLIALREVEERARVEAEEIARRDQERRELEAARALATKEREAAELAQALAAEEQRGREAAERTVILERKARSQQRWLIAALAALTIAAISLAWQARDATRAARQALSAAEVYRVMQGDARPLALLADAVRNNPDNLLARASLLAHLSRDVRFIATLATSGAGRVVLDPIGPHLLFVRATGGIEVWDVTRSQSVAELPTEDVSQAIFTPDGLRFIVATSSGKVDGKVQMFESRTATPIGTEIQVNGRVAGLNSSVDGSRVAVGLEAGGVQIWDMVRGVAIASPTEQNVLFAGLSPDGMTMVTTSFYGDARLWSLRSGATAKPLGSEGATASAAFSPGGTLLVTASLAGFTAQVWDAESGTPIGQRLEHTGPITTAQVSPDETRVVTASADLTARLWHAQTGEPMGDPMAHDARVTSATFSPDGMRVISTSEDRTVRMWDAWTGQPIGAPLRHEERIAGAALSSDDARLVTVTSEQNGSSPIETVRVWDARTGAVIGMTLHHEEPVNAAVFMPDGTKVVTMSGGRDGHGGDVSVWDGQTGDAAARPFHHDAVVLAVATNSQSGEVLVATGRDTVTIWDVGSQAIKGKPLMPGGDIQSLAFSRDLARVVTISDKTAQVWDVATGSPIGPGLLHEASVFAAEFSPDGSRLLTASGDGTDEKAQVWTVASGQRAGAPLVHRGVHVVRFSPDGTRVLTGSEDFTAQLWNAQTQEPIGARMRHEGAVLAAVFSPNGRSVVTCSLDRTARIWNAETGEAAKAPLVHADVVRSAAFSPDGERIVTASDDGTARVWDVRTGYPIGEPFRHRVPVLSATFSSDGTRIVTASADRMARVWDAPVGQPENVQLLADLAEVLGGHKVEDSADGSGAVVPLPLEERRRLLEQLRQRTAGAGTTGTAAESLTRWFLADPWERTITPRSSLTADTYIKRLLEEPTGAGCIEAQWTYPGHPALRRCASEAGAARNVPVSERK